jgi:hypothetical protein
VRDTLALLVLAVGLALPVLAHASPPDPSWIPGVYDDADFDDVVTRIVSGTGSVAPGIVDVLQVTLSPAERLAQAPAAAPEAPRLTANPGRAPPSS